MTHRPETRWNHALGSPSLPYVDSRIYTDPQIFEEELDKIWRNSWVIALHESELPEPLDFRTTTIAREPIVIVRGEDGKVRAFLNVCPHRGALLVRQPSGSLRQPDPGGTKNRIVCMFHAWQFDAKGTCVVIPRRAAGYQDRLQCSQASLKEVACEVGYGGFVWVTLSERPVPLAEHVGGAFGDILPQLASEPLEVFHHHKVVVQTNYKLWHDTNSEFYHDFMHHFNRVTSMQRPGYFERQYERFAGGHTTVSSMPVDYPAYEHGSTALAQSRRLSFPGLELNGWKLLDLFPGATINLRGSALRVDTVTPLAVDRALIEFRGLGLLRDTTEEREQRVRDHNTIWGPFGRNLPEDLLGVSLQGLGMRPGGRPQHVLHGRYEDSAIHDEVGMRHYYAEWSRRLGRHARDPYGPFVEADAERDVSRSLRSNDTAPAAPRSVRTAESAR